MLTIVRHFQNPAGPDIVLIGDNRIIVQDVMYGRFKVVSNSGQVVALYDSLVSKPLPMTTRNLAQLGFVQFVRHENSLLFLLHQFLKCILEMK